MFVTVLLAPILLYLILSGKIASFGASGLFDITLNATLSEAGAPVGQRAIAGEGAVFNPNSRMPAFTDEGPPPTPEPCTPASTFIATAIPFADPLRLPSVPQFHPTPPPAVEAASASGLTAVPTLPGVRIVYLKLTAGCAYEIGGFKRALLTSLRQRRSSFS